MLDVLCDGRHRWNFESATKKLCVKDPRRAQNEQNSNELHFMTILTECIAEKLKQNRSDNLHHGNEEQTVEEEVALSIWDHKMIV